MNDEEKPFWTEITFDDPKALQQHIREVKAAMRREDHRRLVAGEVTREQLSRELSIVDPAARPGRILFSTKGTVEMDMRKRSGKSGKSG